MKWTTKHERAAQMVANKVPYAEIATALKTTVNTVDDWWREQEFRERVKEILSEQRAALMDLGIADKRVRLAYLEDKVKRLEAFFAARATDQQARPKQGFPAVPGAETGLVVLTYKMTPGHSVLEEYAVDTASIAEQRNLLKQAAQELGEWSEKREIAGVDGGAIKIRVVYEDTAESVEG